MTTNQAVLPIYEDELDALRDALRDAVRVLGGNKEVGHALRSDIRPDLAGAWLKDCLNDGRREKLDLSQVMKILRMAHDAGYHGPLQFIANDIGYTAAPVEPQDELAALQRTFNASVSMQRQLVERMERLARAPLAAVGGK